MSLLGYSSSASGERARFGAAPAFPASRSVAKLGREQEWTKQVAGVDEALLYKDNGDIAGMSFGSVSPSGHVVLGAARNQEAETAGPG